MLCSALTATAARRFPPIDMRFLISLSEIVSSRLGASPLPPSQPVRVSGLPIVAWVPLLCA